MSIDLNESLQALRKWQKDESRVQLHPGDIGWYTRNGQKATTNAIRNWFRDGEIVAIGLLDGANLLRLAIAPQAQNDLELAQQMAEDISQPDHGNLPKGEVFVEARTGDLLNKILIDRGWQTDDPWTPLNFDLSQPIEKSKLHVEIVGSENVDTRCAVQRASFVGSTFTKEKWHAMANSPTYDDARCLLVYDDSKNAVATATVWSAGQGRPGLIEPLGVHQNHRGKGYGKEVTLACLEVLKKLGSSSAIVCTISSNVAAVATYKSAGFKELPRVYDLSRVGASSN